MNKAILSLLLVSVCLTASSQEANYQVALIGFYNLENLFDTINQPNVLDDEFTPDGANHYTSKVYMDKLGKLSKVISEIGTDVSTDGIALLGVAEIENRSALEDLVKMPALVKRNYQVAHVDGADIRGVDVGLLYNPKYFKLKNVQSLFVPTKNIDSSYGYTRDILLVSGKLGEEVIHVFVNHWPSRRSGEEASKPYRKLAASVCKQKMDSLLKDDPNAKIIIMGDLNDDPLSESVTKVLGAKGDQKEIKSGELFNPWTNYYKKGIGTLAYNDAWNLFDQIIISQAFLDKGQSGYFFKEAKIFKRDYMIQQTGKYKGYPKRTYNFSVYDGGYSDHFPTYIVLLKLTNP